MKLKKFLPRILTFSIMVIAIITLTNCTNCQNPSDPKVYHLEVEYDQELGSVTYTSPNQDDGYLENTEITVSVLANSGNHVDSFYVNDKVTDLTDNKYVFNILEDTKIKVEFKEDEPPVVTHTYELTQAALTSVQGAITIEGSYYLYYVNTEEKLHHGVVTIFNDDSVYQFEQDLDTGDILYDTAFVNHNGLCALAYINLQNEVVYQDEDEPFDEYDNPFKDLTLDDFKKVSEGKYELVDKKDEVACCISGWDETIKTFYVYVVDDKLTKMEFVTEEIGTDEEAYYSEYSFTFSEYGTASTNVRLTPYERVPEHDALEEALKKVGFNYTVLHKDVWEGEDDVVYNAYVNDKVTYTDYQYEGGLTYGYIEIAGYVYEFSYDGTTVTIGDPFDVESIKEFQSDFTAFDVALFEYVGNEIYVAYNQDIASLVAPYVGYDYDTVMLGNYATSLKIVLKDGVLYQVEFDYYLYGYPGTVTFTYSAFGETTIDIDFSNVVQVSALDAYIGSYENSEHHIEVDESGFVIDGEPFVVDSCDEEGVFYGHIGDVYYYVAKWTRDEIVVYDEEGEMLYIVGKIIENPTVEIPASYKGVWASESYKIVVQTHVVIVNGEEFVLQSYTEETGLIGIYQGDRYYLVLDDSEIPAVLVFTKNDLSVYEFLEKTGETYIEIPEEYVGTWIDEVNDIVVEITYMGITINDIPYEIESYDDYYGFTGTYNGVSEYFIAFFFSEDLIQIGTYEENYVCEKVASPTPGTDSKVQPEHVGTYVGTIDGTEYRIVVTEDSITINGEEYVIESYDAYEGYTGTCLGVTYYLYYMDYDDGISMLLFDDEELMIHCYKEDSIILPEHIGVYVGTDTKTQTEYRIEITKDGITINGEEFNLQGYDPEYEEYYGTYHDILYYVSYVEFYDGPVFDLYDEDGEIFIRCKKQGVTPSVDINPSHYGVYVGTDSDTDTEYRIEITEDGITINGEEFVIEEYDESWEEYYGTYQGYNCYVQYDPDYDVPVVIFYEEDYAFTIRCEKQEDSIIIPEHIGVYVGTDSDTETEYRIEITADKIMINGEEFIIESYDDYYGYYGTYKGEPCDISYESSYIVPAVTFFNEETYVSVLCEKQEQSSPTPTPSVTIEPSYIGVFVGTENDVEYRVEITADKIMINGEEFVIEEYDEYDGYIGTYQGETYYVCLIDYQDPNFIVLSNDSGLYVMCKPE